MSVSAVPDRSHRQVPAPAWLLGLLCLTFAAGLAQPAHSAGITIIVHGQTDGSMPAWVEGMRAAIGSEVIGSASDAAYVDITVSQSLSASIEVRQDVGAGDLVSSTTGEMLGVLNWTQALGSNTPEVAGAAVSALVDGGYTELPMHLIGHSRGASLISEMARLLAEQGVWVDQLTTFDPHPVQIFGFNDADVSVYQNTLFADNYWRTDGGLLKTSELDPPAEFIADPDGQSVEGAYNRRLVEFDEGDNANDLGYDLEHSDVHLWYHGTIDLNTPASDGEESITQQMRETWWTEFENQGVNAGYVYSRLVGGDRLIEPVNSGYHEGLGGDGSRTVISAGNPVWPNIIRFDVTYGGEALVPGVNVVTVGDVLDLNYAYQDYDSASHVDIFLDDDRNPYNEIGDSVYATDHDIAGNAVLYESAPWDTTDMVPGTETYVLAVINDGSHTRYIYAAQSLLFQGPPDDNYEENDMLDEAYDLTGHEGVWLHTVDGLGTQADGDWYEILVSDCNERVIIECHFTHDDGNIDVVLYDSAGSPVQVAETEDDNEYMDFTVAETGTYYVQIHGEDAGNTYDLWWQTMVFPSDPPTDVQATDGTLTNRVEISWTDSPCAADYHVYRNTIDDPDSAEPLGSWQPSTEFIDLTAQAEISHYYWVRARNTSGTSGISVTDTGWREAPEPLDYNPDADDSGTVDAVDIQLVINSALGLQVEYPCVLDDSGTVDAVDIQLVINAALGVGY